MLGSSKKTKLTGAVLAALPLLAAASTTPHPITKVHGGRANKMAYGEPVPSHMDYLVDVGVERYSLGGTAHCTGTLIEPGYILTTAGCFVDDYGTTDASSIKIRLDNGRETITPNVVSLHVPEEYVPYAQSEKELFFGDIAVLYVPELDAPQYSDVNFPRLPEDRAEVDDSPALVSAGYGEDESFNYGEAEFISVQIGGSLGERPAYAYFDIESDHFVARDAPRDDSPGAQDSCGGDAGAPLAIPSKAWAEAAVDDPEIRAVASELINPVDVIVGLTSWGDSYYCGDPLGYTSFTDVLYWKEWIEDVVSPGGQRLIQSDIDHITDVNEYQVEVEDGSQFAPIELVTDV
jgi:hypothetical protein